MASELRNYLEKHESRFFVKNLEDYLYKELCEMFPERAKHNIKRDYARWIRSKHEKREKIKLEIEVQEKKKIQKKQEVLESSVQILSANDTQVQESKQEFRNALEEMGVPILSQDERMLLKHLLEERKRNNSSNSHIFMQADYEIEKPTTNPGIITSERVYIELQAAARLLGTNTRVAAHLAYEAIIEFARNHDPKAFHFILNHFKDKKEQKEQKKSKPRSKSKE